MVWHCDARCWPRPAPIAGLDEGRGRGSTAAAMVGHPEGGDDDSVEVV